MWSLCLFNLNTESIMGNAGPDDSKAAIKIAGRNINNLRYPDDTTVMAESKEELKSLLMRVKEESGKADLKLNIPQTKIMPSVPITSWQIEGKKWKRWQIFSSWAPESLRMVTVALKLEDACFLEGKLGQTKTGC